MNLKFIPCPKDKHCSDINQNNQNIVEKTVKNEVFRVFADPSPKWTHPDKKRHPEPEGGLGIIAFFCRKIVESVPNYNDRNPPVFNHF